MNNNIFFCSDLHLGHKNIVKGITEWKDKSYGYRNFKTLKEHDDTIINTINKYVKSEDILYCIGDFSLGGKENVKKYREQINCKTIHLCVGNHDIHIIKNALLEDGTRLQNLFKSVQTTINKKIHGTYFVLNHYAHRAWPNGANGSINLHGDAHGSLKPYEKLLQIADDPYLFKTGDLYKQMDVGIDVAFEIFKEYKPFHIDEIFKFMENRINLNVDHH